MVKLDFSVFGRFMMSTFMHNTKTIMYNLIKKKSPNYIQTPINADTEGGIEKDCINRMSVLSGLNLS